MRGPSAFFGFEILTRSDFFGSLYERHLDFFGS